MVMFTDTDQAGSPWLALPRPNRRLSAHARAVAQAASALLPEGAGLFMGVESRPGGELRLIWWRSDDLATVAEIGATPEGFCHADTAEGRLQEAGAELLGYLSGRWAVAPQRFGVVTDGVGVAFAPESPAPSQADWLHRHACGSAALLTILPLDPAGPCALLGRDADRSYH
jgi:hypothetical protein